MGRLQVTADRLVISQASFRKNPVYPITYVLMGLSLLAMISLLVSYRQAASAAEMQRVWDAMNYLVLICTGSMFLPMLLTPSAVFSRERGTVEMHIAGVNAFTLCRLEDIRELMVRSAEHTVRGKYGSGVFWAKEIFLGLKNGNSVPVASGSDFSEMDALLAELIKFLGVTATDLTAGGAASGSTAGEAGLESPAWKAASEDTEGATVSERAARMYSAAGESLPEVMAGHEKEEETLPAGRFDADTPFYRKPLYKERYSSRVAPVIDRVTLSREKGATVFHITPGRRLIPVIGAVKAWTALCLLFAAFIIMGLVFAVGYGSVQVLSDPYFIGFSLLGILLVAGSVRSVIKGKGKPMAIAVKKEWLIVNISGAALIELPLDSIMDMSAESTGEGEAFLSIRQKDKTYSVCNSLTLATCEYLYREIHRLAGELQGSQEEHQGGNPS
ncbi:MAG: hypothetical protein RDV48_21890 [Candidatus Eremiobacteraeota bacterium]|nr:hypothetical protein [Candidatus Eremiobacteraeota bacterium]